MAAVAVSSSAINVSWVDTNGDGSSYEVWHSLDGSSFALLATTAAYAQSYRHGGLGAGTTHFYRVRATRTGNGNKVFQSAFAPDPGSVSATTFAATTTSTTVSTTSTSTTSTTLGSGDTTPPAAPTGLVATVVSCSQVNLSWNASSDPSGIAGYRVYTWQNSQWQFLKQVSGTGTSVTGLSGSTTSYYDVSAVDGAGNESAQSAWVSAVTPACGGTTTTSTSTTSTTLGSGDTTPPAAPTGLAATVVSCSQVNLSWNASSDASGIAGYRVYTWQNSQWQFLQQVSGTSTAVTGLSGSSTFYYDVSAVDGAGNESVQSAWVSAVTPACGGTTTTTTIQSADTTPPSVPTNVVATAWTCDVIVVSWAASSDTGGSGLRGYRVYGWRNAQTTFLKEVSVSPFAEGSLGESTTYWYKVSAIDNAGNESGQSGWVSATTPTCSATTSTTSTVTTTTTSSSTTSTTTIAGGTGTPQWATRFGADLGDYGHAVASGPSGEIVLGAQSYSSSVSYGGGALAGGAIVAKYTATGAHVWSRALTWLGSTEAVGVDSAGNVYAAGQFQGSFQVGQTTLTSAGGWDVFLVSFSPTGTPRWARRFGSDLNEYAWGLTVAADDSVVLVADAWSQADYGGGVVAGSRAVARYSASGQYLWSRPLYTSGSAVPQAIAANGQMVVVGGRMTGTMNFGTGALASSGGDGFVAAFALQSSSPQWVAQLGGSGDATVLGTAIDAGGEVLVGGSFTGAGSFGGVQRTAASARDGLVLKLSSAGSVRWVRTFTDAQAVSVATDGNRNVVVAGTYTADTDLGGGTLQRIGTQSVFLAKYDGSGTHVWSHGYVGDSVMAARSVTVDPLTNAITMTGSFDSQGWFGATLLFSVGEHDVFLARYDP